ncbi:hybrid sensor histidine kinase/response regulator [Ramlibacter humi]|uniref:Chemotaxis protein CheA n=1 Tax=Ramlibacter humi TaxID=2530451 RepID=A0A4Z0C9Z6_9BURK|nr:response regulator [Ramlibacter humi]TFZ07712.1 hybrid sensor histidine kinase/response regulator [Ramlibacter humi]
MQAGDADFLRQLRATFAVEAQEHLQAIADGLLQLERGEGQERQAAVIETVFRAAHSLKGAARAVDFGLVEGECRRIEDTLAAWKRGPGTATREALDALHQQLEQVGRLVQAQAARAGTPPANAHADPLRAMDAGQPNAAPPPAAAVETVRISVEGLEARLLEIEEMLAVKQASRQRVEELRELAGQAHASRVSPVSAPGTDAPQVLKHRLAAAARAAEQDREAVGRIVDTLLENSRKLLLLPFDTLAAPLRMMVRDLARAEGKEAELQVRGEHIALDKRILDELKAPLNHLLRNCIAHGVEPPAERERLGKPVRAQLELTATQVDGGKVRITVADDGGGIDPSRLRELALREGLMPAAEALQLTDAQARALVFRSGVSTSPGVTGLSGRGLGLAIVQENAARLGGSVSVDSLPGAGTAFHIVVPALRSTFRGVVVSAARQRFVLPTAQVERVLRPRAGDLRSVDGRGTLVLDGSVIPVVELAQVLQLPAPPRPQPGGNALAILGTGEQRAAFAVDEVLDELQLLVKPLQAPLVRVRNVAAATVLPDGHIACILQVGDLLRASRGAPAAPPAPAPAATAAVPRSILVAEDSITSRSLLRSILESAGYRVGTAVDGLEALHRLQAEPFDLLVTDVEMPRLDGFGLVARLRADPRTAELPIVLVTARESREDRERGVDAGASAYVVKSSFDQASLLETIQRLI